MRHSDLIRELKEEMTKICSQMRIGECRFVNKFIRIRIRESLFSYCENKDSRIRIFMGLAAGLGTWGNKELALPSMKVIRWKNFRTKLAQQAANGPV